MKKIVILILILAIGAGAVTGVVWLRDQQQSQATQETILRTAEVKQGDLEITVAASGNVAVNESIDLRFKQSGYVAEITVQENERINAGQELARLDTTDLERAVQQAELTVEQAKLNLTTLTKPVDEETLELAELSTQSAKQALEVAQLGKITANADAETIVVQAQRARENAFKDYHQRIDRNGADEAYERYEDALEQEHIAELNAKIIRKQAEDQWLKANRNYQQALYNQKVLERGPEEAQIRSAELQIEQATLSLEQAKHDLANAILIAPFDGIIANIYIQEDLIAQTGVPAVTMVDTTKYYIEVTVDEMDISKIDLGQAVEVTLDAYPDIPLSGTVENIDPAATNVAGIISYGVQVYISEIDDAEIRDGMTANVTIYTHVIEDLVLVPNWAIRTDQSNNTIYCYRIQNGIPERVDISIGERNENYTEVITGLEPGMTVALVTETSSLFDPDRRGPPPGLQ